MFNVFLKPKFPAKCKSLIKLTKIRLETVRKKKNAVCKYLKNDIADLLKSGFDYNAYGRAEGLLVEQSRLSVYDFIEKFSDCIVNNLPLIGKERECPEECREAVSSLIYAAARVSELPELRDLRSLFTERYGNSLESFVNQEFMEKFKSEPPSKDVKLQLLHDIAQESSTEWDSKALEQKLFKPPSIKQGQILGCPHALSEMHWGMYNKKSIRDDLETKSEPLDDAVDDGHRRHDSKNNGFQTRDSQETRRKYTVSRGDEIHLAYDERKGSDKGRQQSSSEDEAIASSRRDSTDLDSVQTRSSSVGSPSEDEADGGKPFYYRFIPPPYSKHRVGKDESSLKEHAKPSDDVGKEKKRQEGDSAVEAKPKPRSVRSRFLRPPPGHDNMDTADDGAAKVKARQGLRSVLTCDSETDDEKIMDGLLKHYSKKKSPYELRSSGEATEYKHAKSRSVVPPIRTVSAPPEPQTPAEASRRHARANSLQPEILSNHVHPKLPDYDELAAQLATLRGR